MEQVRKLSSEYYFSKVFMNEIELASHKLFKYMEKTPILNNLQHFSHYVRIGTNNRILRHAFATPKLHVACVCLKVAWNKLNCNYGFIYFTPGPDGTYAPSYISLAPAFTSQDGEYRGRYLMYTQFCKLFETFPEMTGVVEEHVLQRMAAETLHLGSEYCLPLDMQNADDWFINYVDNNRLIIKAYTICWLIDYYSIYHHIEENHINENYKKIFAQPDDRVVFEKIQGADYKLFLKAVNGFYNNLPDRSALHSVIHRGSCGQKIIPLTHAEVALTDDINYSIWRELYIGCVCGNLVINHITPSFPLPVGWYYIQQSRTALFDNDTMRIKYEHSGIAEEITDVLSEVDLLNYKEKNKDFGPISTTFKQLSTNIHSTLDFIDSDIKLSDISIVGLTEYVGKTLQDSARLINGTWKDESILQIYEDPKLFAKMFFEFLYALYCANSKSMIIHGDLHMNNGTIYKFLDLANMKPTIENPSCMFVLRGTTYVFPHNGCYGIIIDFSRSIIGNRKDMTHKFSKRFADIFIRDQNARFLDIIRTHLPDFYAKWSATIINMLIYDFDTIFKFMTILDSYVLANNMLFLLKAKDFANVNVHPDCFVLLTAAAKKIDNLLNSIMQGIAEKQLKFEWPNYTLISALFDDYVFDDKRMKKEAGSINILDVYNENLPLTYDNEDYDSWGPLLDGKYHYDLLKKYVPDDVETALYDRYTDISTLDETAELQNLYVKFSATHTDELEPWMID